MNWTKLPAIEGKVGGCLNCGVRPSLFPLDGIVGVGFGYAGVTMDGQEVLREADIDDPDAKDVTGADAEALAAADPDHDWRIVLEGPLSGRTYQRHGPNEWMLVEQNEGFA